MKPVNSITLYFLDSKSPKMDGEWDDGPSTVSF